MTDPRALLDAYAEEIVDVESDFGVFEPIKRADAAEAMLAALRAVLDLHPRREYLPGRPRCGCVDCSDVHGDPITWPCRTVQAVTAALTSGDTP